MVGQWTLAYRVGQWTRPAYYIQIDITFCKWLIDTISTKSLQNAFPINSCYPPLQLHILQYLHCLNFILKVVDGI